MSSGEAAASEVFLRDLREDRRVFVAEAFFNRHNLLVVLTARKAVRFGRRNRTVAS